MFIVSFRAAGALHVETEYYGPFADYLDAEDFLNALPAVKDCEHKFIIRLADANYDEHGHAERVLNEIA